MDYQVAFNLAMCGVSGLGGWILKIIWDAQVELRASSVELQRDIVETYARRDDFKDMIHALFAKLDRMEDKIDGKADK